MEIAKTISEYVKTQKFIDKQNLRKLDLLKNKKLDKKKIGIIAVKDILIKEFITPSNKDKDKNKENDTESESESDSDNDKKSNFVFTHDFLSDNSENSDNSDNSSDNSVDDNSVDDKQDFDIINTPSKIKKIKVTDFNTCISLQNPDFEIQTRYYRAPEVLLENNFSEKIDVWSLGCTLYELLTKEILINPDNIEDFSEDRYHIYLIHKKIGLFDIDFWNLSRKKYIYLDSNNLLKGFNELSIEPFWVKLINKYGKSQELYNLIDFMLDCLEINPINRKSPTELLSHPFLNN
jgi:hypothetical protein